MFAFGVKPEKHTLVLSLTGSYPSGHSEAFTRPAYGVSHRPRDGSVVSFLHCMNDPRPEGHMASYIRRRKFLATLLGGAAVAWPLAASGQQPERVRRVGVLMSTSQDNPEGQARLAAFLQGLQQLGWTDGRNIRFAPAGVPMIVANPQRNWSRWRQMSSSPLPAR